MLQDFIKERLNKKVDRDGKYGAQCVDLAREWIDYLGLKQPAGVAGAKDMYYNFSKDPNLNGQFIQIKNTPWVIPKPGDIVVWSEKYGPYGHIAIIVDANLMSFTAFSQNDPSNTPCILKKYSYKNVLGFLRKK